MLLYNQFYLDLQETISLLNHLSTFRNQLLFHLIVDFCFSINVNAIMLFFYHLYGLTYDEVLIVDPETPISREEYEAYKEE